MVKYEAGQAVIEVTTFKDGAISDKNDTIWLFMWKMI